MTRISQRNHSPAIHRLGHDILCYIFSLNLYMDDNTSSSEYFDSDDWSFQRDSSLVHIRWLSHVCRFWRDLTLQSSILWARSINLWNLDQKNSRWREEVMKRTGDASLALRGVITMVTKPSTDLLLSILESHWTRLRVLNIAISHADVAKDRRWQALYRPAPNLEVFRLRFSTTITSFSSSADDTLFSGCAPSLYHFCYSHNLLKPSPTASWTAQIRTLTISNICPTIGQIFDILSCIPFIEVLEIHAREIIESGTISTYPFLSPSRLRILKLRCNSRHAATLMRHISTPIGCRFILRTVIHLGKVLDVEETLSLHSSVPHYFSNSIDFHSVQRLYWKLTADEWDLSGDDFKDSDQLKRNHSMIFQLYFSGEFQEMNWSIPLNLLSTFAECDFRKITSLEMEVLCGIDPRNPALQSFLRAFSSVDTIYTQSYTLEWLSDVLLFTPDIFSCLAHLVFSDGLELALDPAAIMRFLLRRRESGLPIQTFDIRKCRSRHQELLLFLEGIDGLSVLWDPTIRRHCDFTNRGWTDVDRDSDS